VLRWSIGFAAGALGPDPIAALTHASGWWAMSLLLATLAVTPLRRISVWLSQMVALRFGRRIGDWNALIRQRRQLGLWSFGYATLHLGLYLGFDIGLGAGTLHAYAQDLAERPFIALGSAALLLLLPLALTSTRAAIRRLKRHWLRLHRLVYAAAVLAALHGVLQAKPGQVPAWVFAGIAAALLAFRLAAAAIAPASAARAAESAAPAARRCGEARPACGRPPRPPSGTTRRSRCS